MGVLGPGNKTGINQSKFINSPNKIVDAQGKAGLGSTMRGSGMTKNMMKVTPPSAGDNSSFQKHGTKMKPY